MKFVLVFAMLFSIKAYAVPFSIMTIDGKSQLNGQIDYPNCNIETYPVVIMVGGTGLFTRNVYSGRSGTERDFFFQDISKQFNKQCIATVRYDYRGVSCDLNSKESIKNCLDMTDRATVTDQTKIQDIESIFEFASSQLRINSNRIVMFGHSEGSINIARWVKSYNRTPKGLLFVSGLTESPQEIIKWQHVQRILDYAFLMDFNGDSILTNEEIRQNISQTKVGDIYRPEHFYSSTGAWTPESLQSTLNNQYESLKIDVLAKPDDELHVLSGIVFSKHQWWRQLFLDSTSVLENLSNYSGTIIYHNGDEDSQAPAMRQLEFYLRSNISMKSRPVIRAHQGKGHGLGDNALYGPMDKNIQRMITYDISKIVHH